MAVPFNKLKVSFTNEDELGSTTNLQFVKCYNIKHDLQQTLEFSILRQTQNIESATNTRNDIH